MLEWINQMKKKLSSFATLVSRFFKRLYNAKRKHVRVEAAKTDSTPPPVLKVEAAPGVKSKADIDAIRAVLTDLIQVSSYLNLYIGI
jgi:hypothetical protein